jgi:hypothetical protein
LRGEWDGRGLRGWRVSSGGSGICGTSPMRGSLETRVGSRSQRRMMPVQTGKHWAAFRGANGMRLADARSALDPDGAIEFWGHYIWIQMQPSQDGLVDVLLIARAYR